LPFVWKKKQLLAEAQQEADSNKGLATMPFESQLVHEQGTQSNLKITLVEQSVFDDLGSEITRSADQSVYVLGWLRIDNRTELSVNLGLAESEAYSDRELILKAYEKWGDDFCSHLVGDYYQDNDCLFVSSSIAVLHAISGLALNVSEEFIVARCMSASADWVKTPYTEVSKVPPASVAEIDLDNIEHISSVKKYHKFDQDFRLKRANESEYIQVYQNALSEAVRCRVSGIEGSIATESSGGIDSSSVAALAAKHSVCFEEKLHAFGYVTCEQEEECINLLSEYTGIENTQLIKDNARDADIASKEVELFVRYAGVLPTAYIATSHAPIYSRAKKVGARVLLSGFGGDEFVTNYAATARIELLKSKQWRGWFTIFKGGFLTKRLRALKWLIRYLIRGNRFETATALLRMTNRMLSFSVVKQDKRDQYCIDQKRLKEASYDAGCDSVNEFSLTNRWSPDMTQRLEDCSLSAASYGIEYRWPLLDIRLVELFLSIPSEYKLRHGLPRYLHRKSIQGLVPEHLIWKDKDMGSPLSPPNFKNLKEEGFIDMGSADIVRFPQEIKDVIDQKQWRKLLQQLGTLESGSVDLSTENQHVMMILQPVMGLAGWLHEAKQKTKIK